MSVRHPEWAMCIGGASCVWDDVIAWEHEYGRSWDGLVIAANDIGAHWPRDLQHWVSLHSNKFPDWEALRRRQALPRGWYEKWTREYYGQHQSPVVDHVLEPWPGGSSGLLAVQVAYTLGCTHVICCGIPMTETAHFAETTEHFNSSWLGAPGHFRGWQRIAAMLQERTRSMSGNTRDLLGAPTIAWLEK